MFSNGPIILAFEEHLQGRFFIFSRLDSQSFNDHIAFAIFLDVHRVSVGVVEQIGEGLVVELQVRN